METFLVKQKVNASKQIILDVPQCREGDEVEVILVVHTLSSAAPSKKTSSFSMTQWAEEWETDLGEDIQSTDVAGFTGRDF